MYEQQQRLSGLDIRRQFRAWRYCLIRRGLALDQANIMCYKEHERLVEKLINARMEELPLLNLQQSRRSMSQGLRNLGLTQLPRRVAPRKPSCECRVSCCLWDALPRHPRDIGFALIQSQAMQAVSKDQRCQKGLHIFFGETSVL